MVHILQGMDRRITKDMNKVLDKDVSNIEIKQTLDQVNLNKAPGLNGMIAYFF